MLGRDAEIRQAIDILTRRRQNNPILTGEAGVGKTAVVEGFALRIASGDVPDVLQDVEFHTLDLGLLQAGAGVKGEFENRLKNVIDEVKRARTPIILFIDEAHTMIGAGGAAGQNDAANLLKPALARGELRTIAATTWAEYKKYFEKDAALARRFQVVKVEEPTRRLACVMMRGMAPLMEKHLNVRVFDEAITEAVRLSHRYISGPPAAGQGGQRARHRLRQGRAGPERHAGAGRRRWRRCSSASMPKTAALSARRAPARPRRAAGRAARQGKAAATEDQRSVRSAGSRKRRWTPRSRRCAAERSNGQRAGRRKRRAAAGLLEPNCARLQGEAPLVPV